MKQLVLSTCKPGLMGSVSEPLCDTEVYAGEVIHTTIKGRGAYLHGMMESIAGYDIPIFLKGDVGQLDEPIKSQDILVVIKDKEYPCIAKLQDERDIGAYYITRKYT